MQCPIIAAHNYKRWKGFSQKGEINHHNGIERGRICTGEEINYEKVKGKDPLNKYMQKEQQEGMKKKMAVLLFHIMK